MLLFCNLNQLVIFEFNFVVRTVLVCNQQHDSPGLLKVFFLEWVCTNNSYSAGVAAAPDEVLTVIR